MNKKDESKKHKVLDALLEGVIEVILSLVFLAIGGGIFALFGVALDSEKVDFDLLILVGLVAFFSVFGIISYIVQRRKKKKLHKSPEEI